MDDEQQSRWLPTRRQVLWTSGIVVAMALLISLLGGYLFGWKWTGLPKQTLWDWLDLLVVPLVLALGGYLFTRSENQRTRGIAEQQRILDRDIAEQRRQDDTLQAYLDGMSQLLTDQRLPLHSAQPGDSLSTLARARTLAVLPGLDGERKRSVLQFLYESGLLTRDRLVHNLVLNLEQSELAEANLYQADLSGANLSGANLRGASLLGTDLSGALLNGADLTEADLREASLPNAYLDNADLSGAWLYGANVSKAVLPGASLLGADLRGTDLSEAWLYRVDLTEAVLNKANLSSADLSGAWLYGADLTKADLRKANLGRADLRKADLFGADLTKAYLSEANLSGALGGITNEELERQAETLQGATMPNGQKYEDRLKSNGRGEDGENSGST